MVHLSVHCLPVGECALRPSAGSASAVCRNPTTRWDDQATRAADTVGTVKIERNLPAAVFALPDHRPGVDMLGQQVDLQCGVTRAVPPRRLVRRLLIQVEPGVKNNVIVSKPGVIIATARCATSLAA
jgi:hypothetical protein